MGRRGRIARITAAGAAIVGLVLGGMVFADAAYAASSVSITPGATTVASGTATTYTLNFSCSGTPSGCGASTVSFPTTTITGDGTTIDFGSWVTAGTCPSLTKSGGVASFDVTSFIGTANATQQCAFTVRAPEYTTLPGAVATITPTLTTANGGTSPGSAVTLTSTAAHNSGFTANAPAVVVPGGTMSFSLFFKCSATSNKVGDVGADPISITAQLPANFTYTGHSSGFPGTFTTPAVGSQGGTFSYTGSYADCNGLSGTATGFTVAITGTATGASGPDAPNDTVCAIASASWTYLDDTTPTTSANSTPCTTVNAINTTAAKTASTTSPLGNAGQFKFGAATPLYTFPGNWDGTGAGSSWTIAYSTTPSPAATAGVSYGVQEPLPCLTGGPVAGIYASLAPGTACANPGFVPTAVTPSGFTPAPGATITLLFANGTTGTVAFSAGKWVIPTTTAVSEIDLPAFVEQGSNNFATMSYKIDGYASAAATPGTELQNMATVTSYLSSDLTSPISTVKKPTAILGIADPTTVSIRPNISQGTVTSCTTAYGLGNTSGRQNLIQFAQGTSQALYYDFLLPPDATYSGAATSVFRLTNAAHTYTSAAVTPTQTPNYNGTGRTLIQWIIPAGLAQVPGTYQLSSTTGFSVTLPAGCSGTYPSDITLGYGGPTQIWCIAVTGAVRPPLNPSPTSDLTSNGTPTANNYCGYSAPLTVAPINPGFSIDKAVKGDLDASMVNGGGIGKVSPSGGSATYTVTFKNTGQSNLHDPVMYDLLPRTGDARGSQFDVALANVPTPATDVTIEYTTAANPCRPEVLADASNPGCTVNAFSTTPPAPLSDATALRISYDGTVGVSGSPFTQTVTVAFGVTTPTVTNGQTAWNTVVTNAHTGDTGDPAATDDLLTGLSSAKTGLTASDGVPQIVKASTSPSYSAVGNTISYTFTVTNNAAATLTNITVVDAFTDAPAGAAPPTVTCPVTTLAPNDSTICTAIYTVTQDDIDNGRLADVATATGTSSGGGTISNTSNGVTVPAVATPSIALTKSASPTSVASAGSTINYSFLVANTGNQTVHGLSIDDPKVSGVTCLVTTLAPAASTTCTASYLVTQADMDSGSITNTATATALDPTGAARTSTSSAVVSAPSAAHLTLTKSASPTSVSAVGDAIAYGFHVVNDGTVTLTGITVADPMLAGVTCPIADLAPADAEDCTGSYTVTQADLDAGTITNTATASGTSPAGATITGTSSAAVTVTQTAVLTLSESVDQPKATAAGQVLHFTFHVVNAGNVTVTGVTVQETGFTGTGGAPVVTCPTSSLAPGDTMDCTASYTVAAADLALARIANPASATGVTSAGSVPPGTSTAEVIIDPPTAASAAVLAATGVANLATGIVSGIGLLGLGLALLIVRRRPRDA
ncbi:MAG TPA: hypothetical protein VGM70_02925 [Pseudolysinimonas sp.]|jgi:uncharacterized repeat protein (TIGR01451 family)